VAKTELTLHPTTKQTGNNNKKQKKNRKTLSAQLWYQSFTSNGSMGQSFSMKTLNPNLRFSGVFLISQQRLPGYFSVPDLWSKRAHLGLGVLGFTTFPHNCAVIYCSNSLLCRNSVWSWRFTCISFEGVEAF